MQTSIKVYLLDGQEKELGLSYQEILHGLQQNDNTNRSWILFDYQTGELVDQQSNIEDIEKLRALTTQQIEQIFHDQKEYRKLKEAYQNTIQELIQTQLANRQIENIQIATQVGAINVVQLSNQLQEKEFEIQQLKFNLMECKTQLDWKEQKICKLEQSIQFNNKNIKGKNTELTELRQIKNKSQEFETEIAQLYCEKEQLQHEIEKLVIFKQRSEHYEKILKKQNKTIINKVQVEQLQQNLQDQHKTNQQYDTQNQTRKDIESFYCDEDTQKQKETIMGNINNNQVKFLNSLLNKLTIDIQQGRKIKPCSTNQLGRIPPPNVDIYQVFLISEEFEKILEEKDFFIRDRFLNKKNVGNISQKIIVNSQQYPKESIMIDGQIIWIQLKTPNQKPYLEHEALDIISSQLLVENFAKLYDEILNQTLSNVEEFSKQKIKFPKLFLVKDQENYYYVFQECLNKSNCTQYQYFQELNSFHNYLNSFLYYFYISMNENLVITEYELESLQYENQDVLNNSEILIKNMVVHSNYQQAFSLLDKGKDQIQIVKKMNLKKQSQSVIDKLNNLKMHAQKNWIKKDL